MENKLFIYPEYPDSLPRNYDYEVYVSGGEEFVRIPVYDVSRQTNNFGGDDLNRRFCEFGFDGEVTVKIKVRAPFESFNIMPSNSAFNPEIRENEITFKLTKPQNLVFRINGSKYSVLAIFAESIETEIPDESDENVWYFKAGENNCEKYALDNRGALVIPENTTVYLAPGALVSARVSTYSDNVKVCGRGSFIDSRLDRNPDPTSTFAFLGWNPDGKTCIKNLVLKDVKFLDSHTFNVCLWNIENILIDGVKLLSNQISTDGISLWGEVKDIEIKNVFMHVTDNALVFDAAENVFVHDCVIGTDFGIMYPQGYIHSLHFKDLDIFRSGNFLRACENRPWDEVCWDSLIIENVRAEDAGFMSMFVYLREQHKGRKNVLMKNVTLPGRENKVQFDRSEGCRITLDNVYIGGKRVDSDEFYESFIRGGDNEFIYTPTCNEKAANLGYRIDYPANYKGAIKMFVGDWEIDNCPDTPYIENGEVFVPTIMLDELNVPHTESGFISLSEMKEKYSVKAEFSENSVRAIFENYPENFIPDPSMEQTANSDIPIANESLGCNFKSYLYNAYCYIELYNVKNPVHSGENALHIVKRYRARRGGLSHDMAKNIKKCGKGTYHLSVWARLGMLETYHNPTVYFGLVKTHWRMFDDEGNKIGLSDFEKFTLTHEWQKIEYDVKITDPNHVDYNTTYFLVATGDDETTPKPDGENNIEFDCYLDDACVTFTPDK